MGGPGFVDGEERDEFANFFPCSIEKDGIVYPSAEHFFQAHKTLEEKQRQRIASASFEEVYGLGQAATLRPDWEAVKLEVMLEAAERKYAQNPKLAKALLATKGEEMTFTPSAGFWGVDAWGCGENWNGRIHAIVRAKMAGDSRLHTTLHGQLLSRCAALRT
ncbi:ybiA [Symbiodinium sp. CCMP2456]|nr:ybiA [Symbiodinium sp. CCMP2456]